MDDEEDQRSITSSSSHEEESRSKMRAAGFSSPAAMSDETRSSLQPINDAADLAKRETLVLFLTKCCVVAILLVAAVIMAAVTYRYTRNFEIKRFHDCFDNEALYVVDTYRDFIVRLLWAGATMSAKFSRAASLVVNTTNYVPGTSTFPFLALGDFDLAAFSTEQVDHVTRISYAPLVGDEQRDEWEAYAMEHISSTNLGFESPWSTSTGIYELDEANREPVPSQRRDISSPVWQVFPVRSHGKYLMFDLMSDPVRKRAIAAMQEIKSAVPSDFLLEEVESVFNEIHAFLQMETFFPVFNDTENREVVGSVAIEWDWTHFFQNNVAQLTGEVDVVIDNGNCGDIVTFQLRSDSTVSFRGKGDMHNVLFDDHEVSSTTKDFRSNLLKLTSGDHEPALSLKQQTLFSQILGLDRKTIHNPPEGFCEYTIRIFPTDQFQQDYLTSRPRVYVVAVVAIFIFALLVFFSYDYIVEKRQRIVMENAVSSRAIVDSLFPSIVRERLLGHSSHHSQQQNRGDWTKTPKIRLATFLKHARSSDDETLQTISQSEPIAEVFHETTVVLADISGFTAWSSEREPSQVFRLLEAVYAAFDQIAHNLGVFKVETIGDCYVAVTGLPHPNKNHAVIMARFASECISAMIELTRELEITLGPGTSNLKIRIGLHSGPITAGVLRGEKSRFQLFGDTINTASRMESNGLPSRTQVSQATADAIRAAGKGYWLIPRSDLINAKGKGLLQTYWCDPKRRRPKLTSETSKSNFGSIVASDGWEDLRVDDGFDLSDASSKKERLIEWNTDLLLGKLAKLVATHGPVRRKRRLSISTTRRQSNIKSSLSGDDPAVHFDLDLPPRSTNSTEAASLDPLIRSQLREYVGRIASLYQPNPFHNFEHASHVALSANKLLNRIIPPSGSSSSSPEEEETSGKKASKRRGSSRLDYSTFGIQTDALIQFCVVLGALVHDVGHTGVPNAVLIAEKADVATRNNNKSVAERHAVQLALCILEESTFADLRACIYANEAQQSRFQMLLVNIVIATDIHDKDLREFRDLKWEQAFHCSNEGEDEPNAIASKAMIVVEHIIQASDVAHTMQHWHVYSGWNSKLFEEMYAAYQAGRIEVNPADVWYQGEIDFFDKHTIPLARKLKECGVFGISSNEVLAYALAIREEWISKGEIIVLEMLEIAKA
jgi:class 3 adenylate cyclase